MARGPRTLTLAALLLFTAAAAVNYERNLRDDLASRPFGGYDDDEIALLLDAYRGDAAAWKERAVAVRPGDVQPAGRDAQKLLREFEEAQRRNQSWRQVVGELGTKEALVRQLEAEQRERAERRLPQQTLEFLRRLFTV